MDGPGFKFGQVQDNSVFAKTSVSAQGPNQSPYSKDTLVLSKE